MRAARTWPTFIGDVFSTPRPVWAVTPPDKHLAGPEPSLITLTLSHAYRRPELRGTSVRNSLFWTILVSTVSFLGVTWRCLASMEKTIYSEDYKLFLQRLRKARQSAGLSQFEVAARLGKTQSFVSKCERGERRLDLVEVRAMCRAIGISLSSFVADLEKTLSSS